MFKHALIAFELIRSTMVLFKKEIDIPKTKLTTQQLSK